MSFKLYQMDVKSTFFKWVFERELFVWQPIGFKSHEFPDHVFKLDKALYGLKQTLRAWYERL